MEPVNTAGVGRGRGNATNVPERALIDQVRMRPLLYDKAQIEYRKPGVSDAAWSSVAEALNTSVSNCKKRWKSLRDTFIKYYRFEVLDNNSDNRRRQKFWNFYQDLSFLKQHVELFRLDESARDGPESCSSFTKESNRKSYESDQSIMIEDPEAKEVYVIKIAGEEYEGDDDMTYKIREDHLDAYVEQIDDEYGIIEHEEEDINKSPEKSFNENFGPYETEPENDNQTEVMEEISLDPSTTPTSRLNELEAQKTLPDSSPDIAISSSSKNVVDPDERYLMSCLPAFKRFTPQQKAYVRMGIEKLFYEVEFGNISEPKNKRSRTS